MRVVLRTHGIAEHLPMAKRKFDLKKSQLAVGATLRKMRHQRGWSLEATEEKGWGNWRSLQAIESGRNVKLSTLLSLANLYGVHPSEILKDI